jgi:site-specific DNA-methyltransferase (adenine-specific)
MDIRPYPKNAKKHPKKQIDQIAKSIKEFGFNQTIVVDKQGVIIVGHGRYEALKSLGMEIKDEYIKVVDLTEEQAKSYRLADNKLNESDWDMDLVIEELKGLTPELLDLTGFDKDLIIEPEDRDDEVPEIPIEPQSKLGDLYELGSHRVLCGDSTREEAVLALTGGNKADMVFTDPPYNVNYSGRGENTSNTILNDKMSDSSFDLFLTEVFKRYSEVSKEGSGWYVFHSSSTQHQFQKAIEDSGWKVKNQIIWNKPVASMGWGDYRWKHEPMFYCGKEGTQFYGDRCNTTVLNIPEDDKKALVWLRKQKELEKTGHTTIWSMKRDNVNGYVHPTQKPVELICYALSNSSKAGDIVLDFFGGSGSTLIACQKMSRGGYLMELDPKYVDVIGKIKEGRPTVMTPDTINKLESVFAIGGTDKEACSYADISHQTLYDYQHSHPEFVERKEMLKERPFIKARQTIVKALDNPHDAQWFMERKRKKEFAYRNEVTGPEGEPLILPSELINKNDINTSPKADSQQ